MEYTLIAHSVIADLDNDGDNDVIATTSSTDLVWWQNNGIGDFSSTQIINNESTGNYDLKILDVNGDNKLDIIISDLNGIYWFQNNLTLGIENLQINNQKITIFPNPSKGKFFINSSLLINKIVLYDDLGNLIQNYNNFHNEIDLTNINVGLYILKIVTGNNIFYKKIIKK